MLIYAAHTTTRLTYIVQTLLGEQAIITNDVAVFGSSTDVKINYSNQRITNNELWVVPHSLLFEQSVLKQSISCQNWNGLPIFFASGGDIPFDFLAASFYLLTRYEEYVVSEKDLYGRFLHTESIAYKFQFLERPLINEWMLQIEQYLQQFQRNFFLQTTFFYFQPTYDIDIAYRYLDQAPLRNIGGFYRDLLMGQFDKILERSKVYSGRQADPYDIYSWLDHLHADYSLEPLYFFLMAEKRNKIDRNTDPFTKGMKSLIQSHAVKYTLGIHPSWQSGFTANLIEREKKLLAYYAGQDILHSRQHYLCMSLPQTYRQLIVAGIQHDHTMGYGAVNGFRASYARSFRWYDLVSEAATGLTVHPFCYMDSTAIFGERLNAEQAMEQLQQYYERVRKVNGVFISIFHNHFLTTQPEWLPWRNLYAGFLKKNC